MDLKSPIPIDQLTLNEPVPYKIEVDRELLAVTKKKLELARYPEEQSDFGEDDWSQGAKVSRVKQLAQFWKDEYDWKKQENILNTTFNHYLVKLDVPGHGPLVLHYTHTKSPSPTAIPLLFSHGWPGSIIEATKVLSPLTNPEDPSSSTPSFHLVAPSIPGFGFSPAPTTSGVGPTIVARAYKLLMTDVLGYDSFITQGGDFGSFITRSMALQFPAAVRAQHLNMFPVPPPTLLSAPLAWLRWRCAALTYSEWEREALAVRQDFEARGSGYLEQQRTRPQTLGFGLGDSPVGLLAWFVEKLHAWMEVREGLSDEEVITLVMMHWIQGATPGLRFYREAFGERREAERTFEAYVAVPTGVSMYPKEQLHCPRDWAAQAANIKFWKEHTRGGHFSSLERPDLFVADLREFVQVPAVEKSIMKGR